MTAIRNQIKIQAFRESLQKWAQGFSDTLSDIAKPALFGLGGYAAARALGAEKQTGIPDYLLGPTVGLGAAMPLASAISKGIKNRRNRQQSEQMDEEQQARLEDLLQQEQEMQAQMQAPSQQMQQQMMAYQMGMPPDMMRTASLRKRATGFSVPAAQAENVMTQAQQRVTQQQQQQQQQQLSQAAVAQQIKAQFRGLQQAKTKQVTKQLGG